MEAITEPEVDSLLRRLQQVAEQAPVHLRPKRRQVMRGMRAALSAMAETPTLEGLRDQLLYELTGTLPASLPVVQVAAPKPLTPLQQQVIRRLDAGMTSAKICEEVGCTKHLVTRCRRLQRERRQEMQCASPAQFDEVTSDEH